MRLSSFQTATIPIYRPDGGQTDEISLPEAIRPAMQRRSGFSDSGVYYKGAGIIYSGHFVNNLQPGMLQVSANAIPYQKYQVLYPALYRKFGIFTFPHQPVFSVYEGGCGPKEENLLTMQKIFHYSAIDGDIEVISTPLPNHRIYAYRLKKLSGSYKDTLQLLEYILAENFNCAWDKNVWADIYCYGYVRDLADWFISEHRQHKLGTVYSLLNSINKSDKYLYGEITGSLTGLSHLEPVFMPYISALIVAHYCPSCMDIYDLTDFNLPLYEALLNDIYSGKACCHLENEAADAGTREYYKQQLPQKTALMEKTLAQHSRLQ